MSIAFPKIPRGCQCPLCRGLIQPGGGVPTTHVTPAGATGRLNYTACTGQTCPICQDQNKYTLGGSSSAGGGGSFYKAGGGSTVFGVGGGRVTAGGGGGGAGSSSWQGVLGGPNPSYPQFAQAYKNIMGTYMAADDDAVDLTTLPTRKLDEPLRAWKVAKIVLSPTIPDGIGFWPMYQNVGYTADKNEFKCVCGDVQYWVMKPDEPHKSITDFGAKCGWYGMKTDKLLRDEIAKLHPGAMKDGHYLWALECDFYGRTIGAPHGYRSAKQRVLSVRPLEHNPWPFQVKLVSSTAMDTGLTYSPADLASKLHCDVIEEPMKLTQK